jgi:hypothetical protein
MYAGNYGRFFPPPGFKKKKKGPTTKWIKVLESSGILEMKERSDFNE